MSDQYILRVTDDAGRYKMILTLDAEQVSGTAEDLIFGLLGEADPKALVEEKILGEAYLSSFEGLRALIFDRDEQGAFIREGVGFESEKKEIQPDVSFKSLFRPKTAEGMSYYSGHLTVVTSKPLHDELKASQMKAFRLLMLLHMVSIGKKVDVIHVDPDLAEAIAEAEAKGWLEIDTKNAVYRLTPEGEKAHRAAIEEAQELIRRYDLYSDVEVDPKEGPIFCEGQGDDLRVPVWEYAGINPFRARFVLGLNDGEWDELPDWAAASNSEDFYGEVFEPVEMAPTVEEIGREKLERIVAAGRRFLRENQGEETDWEENDSYFDRPGWW
ncbi:MAG: hypothetical protein ACM3YO_07975 [Bacteroidota bacterium]